MNEAELRAHLEAILRSKLGSIDPEIVDGKRHYVARFKSGEVRARLQFRFKGEAVPATERETRITAMRARLPEGALTPALERSIARAKEADAPKTVLITGTASSTSVDWYGTEMSLRALQGMADQFRAGVDVTPKHHSWIKMLEWDDVMGRTVMASIDRSDIVEPAVPGESGFTLSITGECYEDDEKTQELVKRLARGQAIGLSIGGWFTEVRYVYSDDGDLERIIIEAVELDHVAVVRAPANPDCMDLEVMRSVAAEAFRARAAAPPSPAPAPEARTAGGDPAPVASPPAARAGEAPAADAERGEKHDMESCSADCSFAECACSCHGERSAPPAPASPAASTDAPSGEDARNRAPVTTAPVFDTPDAARNAGPEAGGSSAASPPSNEADMTPEQLEAILQRALAPLQTRLDALEASRSAAPAPAPTPAPAPADEGRSTAADDAVVTDLRAQLAREKAARENAEAAVSALVDQPSRGGRAAPLLSTTPEFARSELDQLVARAKSGTGRDKAPTLAIVASRSKEMLTANMRARGTEGQKLRQYCEDAPDLLRSICMAAERDGVIGNLEAGWQ